MPSTKDGTSLSIGLCLREYISPIDHDISPPMRKYGFPLDGTCKTVSDNETERLLPDFKIQKFRY